MNFILCWAITMGLISVGFALSPYLTRKWPWHFSLENEIDGQQLTVCTPWWGIQIANDGFDVRSYRRWSGVLILRRIKGTEHLDHYTGRQIFEDWYRYESPDVTSTTIRMYGER